MGLNLVPGVHLAHYCCRCLGHVNPRKTFLNAQFPHDFHTLWKSSKALTDSDGIYPTLNSTAASKTTSALRRRFSAYHKNYGGQQQVLHNILFVCNILWVLPR